MTLASFADPAGERYVARCEMSREELSGRKVERKLRARHSTRGSAGRKAASRLKILKRRGNDPQRGSLRSRGESSEKRLLVAAGDRKPVVKSVYILA